MSKITIRQYVRYLSSVNAGPSNEFTDLVETMLFMSPYFQSQKNSVSIGNLWPGQELSGKTVMFMVTWPFVAHGIISVLSSMRKK